MSLRTKLLAGFLAVSLIGAAIGLIGIFSLSSVKDAEKIQWDQGVLSLKVLNKMTDDFSSVRVAIRDAILSSDESVHLAGVSDISYGSRTAAISVHWG